MKLSKILIEAGVTPSDLHHHCELIAQDWQTPLSREQFIADYEEYVKNK